VDPFAGESLIGTGEGVDDSPAKERNCC